MDNSLHYSVKTDTLQLLISSLFGKTFAVQISEGYSFLSSKNHKNNVYEMYMLYIHILYINTQIFLFLVDFYLGNMNPYPRVSVFLLSVVHIPFEVYRLILTLDYIFTQQCFACYFDCGKQQPNHDVSRFTLFKMIQIYLFFIILLFHGTAAQALGFPLHPPQIPSIHTQISPNLLQSIILHEQSLVCHCAT